MEKNLIFLVLAAALFVPARAGAQPAYAPAASSTGAANGVLCATCPAGGSLRNGIPDKAQVRKKMTRSDVVTLMESPEDSQKKKKILKRKEGGDTDTSFKITVPKGNWRIVWSLQATDEKESGVLVLGVDTAVKTNYHQAITKEIRGLGEEAIGVMNICDVKSRKFRISLSAKKAKWSIEIQSLYD